MGDVNAVSPYANLVGTTVWLGAVRHIVIGASVRQRTEGRDSNGVRIDPIVDRHHVLHVVSDDGKHCKVRPEDCCFDEKLAQDHFHKLVRRQVEQKQDQLSAWNMKLYEINLHMPVGERDAYWSSHEGRTRLLQRDRYEEDVMEAISVEKSILDAAAKGGGA